MEETVDKRISLVKETNDVDKLRECLCPFFEKGGYEGCDMCRKSEDELLECKAYYLERIRLSPQDLWTEEFDNFISTARDKVPLEELSGIGMSCNSCYLSKKCPAFKRNYSCGIEWGDKKPETPAQYLDFLIGIQYERVQRGATIEKIDGGVADAGLSVEIDRLNGLVASKIDMGREKFSINVEARGAAETSSGGGILSRIFGGAPASTPPTTISIPAKPESRGDIMDVDIIEEPEKVCRKRKSKECDKYNKV